MTANGGEPLRPLLFQVTSSAGNCLGPSMSTRAAPVVGLHGRSLSEPETTFYP